MFRGAIFDLDGVISKTAVVHRVAWTNTFNSFLKKSNINYTFTAKDYLKYLDGKPREEGVISFLSSKKIKFSKKLVDEISSKKNKAFRAEIKANGVETYSSTVSFIKKLKKKGIKVAVASSSKNAKFILRHTDLGEFIDTIVDGSALKDRPGKPEPDIFLEAAKRIGVECEDALIVEDAISGVLAARNGGFKLVIGTPRETKNKDLFDNGADICVKEFNSNIFKFIDKWFKIESFDLFKNWNKSIYTNNLGGKFEGISVNPSYKTTGLKVFRGNKKPIFFLDYDGTLTNIVSRPEDAVINSEMKKTITKISKKYTTAIVSGRMREDVMNLAGVKSIFYGGSHGFDILGPKFSYIQPDAKKKIPIVNKIIKNLKKELKEIEGIKIEEKKFSVAVHYRLVTTKSKAFIEKIVKKIIKPYDKIKIMSGKKVFEIMPDIDWDKGKAVRWILNALKKNWENYNVIFIGDDTTDEYAFRSIKTRGYGVMVSPKKIKSNAEFRVSSPEDVKKLFDKILN